MQDNISFINFDSSVIRIGLTKNVEQLQPQDIADICTVLTQAYEKISTQRQEDAQPNGVVEGAEQASCRKTFSNFSSPAPQATFHNHPDYATVKGMTLEDVVGSLEHLGLIRYTSSDRREFTIAGDSWLLNANLWTNLSNNSSGTTGVELIKQLHLKYWPHLSLDYLWKKVAKDWEEVYY